MGHLRLAILFLSCLVSGCSGSTGETGGSAKPSIPTVARVREFVVEMATATGDLIREKASSLSAAIMSLWRRLLPEWSGNVQVDSSDPQRGVLRGEYRLRIDHRASDGGSAIVDFKFSNPAMRRSSPEAEWELDPSNYEHLLSHPDESEGPRP